MSVDLCGCSHANDHVGKPCQHEAPAGSNLPKCPCPSGMRADIATLRQLSQIAIGIQSTATNSFKILTLMQAVTGAEVLIEKTKNGDVTVSVVPMKDQQQQSGIVGASSIPNISDLKKGGLNRG